MTGGGIGGGLFGQTQTPQTGGLGGIMGGGGIGGGIGGGTAGNTGGLFGAKTGVFSTGSVSAHTLVMVWWVCQ